MELDVVASTVWFPPRPSVTWQHYKGKWLIFFTLLRSMVITKRIIRVTISDMGMGLITASHWAGFSVDIALIHWCCGISMGEYMRLVAFCH